MLKKIYAVVFILIVSVLGSQAQNRFYDMHKKRVEEQHDKDLSNKEAVLDEIKGFLGEMNKRIESKNGFHLSLPLDEKEITGITGEHVHYRGAIPPVIFGYVNTKSLNMRSEDDQSSALISKLVFKEEVEILFQSDKVETIDSITSPWLLVKKGDGSEGWVFGGYVSDKVPLLPDKDENITDWGMIIPVSGRISSKFGYRVDPITKKRGSFHKGIDIAARIGTPVYAAEKGVVEQTGFYSNGYGNLIVVKHDRDLATYYGHLSEILVKKGHSVSKGTLIGKVGNTGRSTGPHLHFEVRKGGEAMNPEEFFVH
ncbi:MAG: peptidoglycan DD-metalloendopeptidase family protein [Spirochaetota bacterium]